MPGRLTAVDVQQFAGDKCGALQIEDSVDNVANLAEPTQGVEGRHSRIEAGS